MIVRSLGNRDPEAIMDEKTCVCDGVSIRFDICIAASGRTDRYRCVDAQE
jgi:hypothetical protein